MTTTPGAAPTAPSDATASTTTPAGPIAPAGTDPSGGPPAGTPPGPRLAEVTGYAGGALLAGAAGYLCATTAWWAPPGVASALLVGVALVLAVGGAVLAAGSGAAELRAGTHPVRRRLVSTLWVLAAWALGAAVEVLALRLDDSALAGGPDRPNALHLVAALLVLVAGAAGYRFVPSVLAQTSAWLAAASSLAAALDVAGVGTAEAYGTALVALGLTWAVLALTGVVRERATGLVLAVLAGVLGAQTAVFGDHRPVGHALTAAVAVACFAAAVRERSWPLRAGGVAAVVLLLPEVAHDLLARELPVVLVLLGVGVALLATSVTGLRRRAG